MPNFDEWFKRATGNDPFPYQRRFAEEGEIPELVDVPTGCGKTVMAVLGWLWRRRFANEETRKPTPRRLVYCLPMRVLVEQTRDSAVLWLHNVEMLAGTAEFEEEKNGGKRLCSYTPDFSDPEKVAVHLLMGGEDEEDWDVYPEREQILIGTQDMLLSRALNRGYAASRARWPMQFGLLHTDCLWVFDEIQLMGVGLATAAQLEAFRRLIPDKGRETAKNSHGCRSVWMSATIQGHWLKTVDFSLFVDDAQALTFQFEKEITAHGLDNAARRALRDRWEAKKPLKKAEGSMGNTLGLAEEILQKHQPGTRTIVVLNTVKRACELYEALNTAHGSQAKKGRKSKRAPDLGQGADALAVPKPAAVLLHSRFRLRDRKRQVEQALSEVKPGEPGMIVVSTQVIEAGVDVSATTMFTEQAPWASLVQRFGRCNRRGKDNDIAAVYWIAMPAKGADAEKVVAPYELEDLKAAEEQLKKLTDVGLRSLPDVPLPYEHGYVIRRRDLIDLFDTTPDFAGNDIDIGRFVREIEESDVRVFWRDWEQPKDYEPPPEDSPAPRQEELCAAPIGELRKFATDQASKSKVWRWSFLEKKWERADAGKIAPGQVFLVHAEAGGYSAQHGWDPSSKKRVDPIVLPGGVRGEAPDATEDERLSRIGVWQTVAEHAGEVCSELNAIVRPLSLASDEVGALLHAARWHDRGKAHEIFRAALPEAVPDGSEIWAKAAGTWKRYTRRHFRHELASALAVLVSPDGLVPVAQRDLVAYLVAAHHGKVRLSIRSLPNELRPDGNRRFARGIWDGDPLPETDLGGGILAPAVRLSLEPMELGLCEEPPFTGQHSWAERIIRLRDSLSPFCLGYVEALLRAADMRASKKAEERAAVDSGREAGYGV
ncbi:MAG: DEAD/DEAH box helicase [Candidatus Binatia bacterium]